MIQAFWTISSEGYDFFVDGLRTSPEIFLSLFKDVVVPDIEHYANTVASKVPGPVKYPFKFATARSQRAYFATHGFGHGIPYKRSHTAQANWQTMVHKDSENVVAVEIFNILPWSIYLYGPRQVPGHRTTGWPQLDVILEQVGVFAEEQIGDLWILVLEENVP